MGEARRELIKWLIEVATKGEVGEGGRQRCEWLVEGSTKSEVGETRREEGRYSINGVVTDDVGDVFRKLHVHSHFEFHFRRCIFFEWPKSGICCNYNINWYSGKKLQDQGEIKRTEEKKGKAKGGEGIPSPS